MKWIIKDTKNYTIKFDYENMELIMIKSFNVVSRKVIPYPASAIYIMKKVDEWIESQTKKQANGK